MSQEFPLPTRRLGRTGLEVTPLGLGGVWLGYDGERFSDELAVETVHRALELGITLIDTSPLYPPLGDRGESERWIGLALEAWEDAGGSREDVVLSTKVGTRTDPFDYSAAAVRESVRTSLDLLRTDYLDVVHVHDPPDLDPVLAPGGALDALADLVEEGVVGAVGLGVREHEFHRRLIERDAVDVSLIYRDYNLLDQSATDVLEAAAAHDVGVLDGMVIVRGLLSGEDPEAVARRNRAADDRLDVYLPDDAEVRLARDLWEWARDRGLDLLDLNLQYCLREPRIDSVLLGAATPAQIERDVAAVAEPIPEPVWEDLDEAFDVRVP
jgi:aryl-alcohol dehydrogenase-like predicted oxidoreductase